MMKSDTLNWYDYVGYTKITALSSNVNSTDEDESKRIIVHEYFFRKKVQIKTKHCQRNFIAELFRGGGQTMSNGDRQIRIHTCA